MFEKINLLNFWNDSDYAKEEYIEETPTDQEIEEIEKELGYKLPESYIWLMKKHNGGIPVKKAFPTKEATNWASDHIAISGIMGIGKNKTYSLCGELGSKYLINEWQYPPIGVVICNCPSGSSLVFLDYTESDNEPKVSYVEADNDYKKIVLANNFEKFICGLVSEDKFD